MLDGFKNRPSFWRVIGFIDKEIGFKKLVNLVVI
jgi:hypothetical protein